MKLSALKQEFLSRLKMVSRADMGRAFLVFAILTAFLVMGWPADEAPLTFPDSKAYINWPDEYWIGTSVLHPEESEEQLFVMGQRPPVYPLFLNLIGTGANLTRVQFVVSLLSLCFLGFCVARTPGLIVGGVFALFPAIWIWNGLVLTESLSMSLTALALCATLILLRRWTWPRFICWVGALLMFAFIRDVNLYALPFLAVPALRTTWWRSGLVLATPIVLFALGTHLAEKYERGRWPLMNALSLRIHTDTDALAEFERAGMPSNPAIIRLAGWGAQPIVINYQKNAPEYLEWIRENGVRTYQVWLLRHPENFIGAHQELIDRINYYPALYAGNLTLPESVMNLKRIYNMALHWILWWPILLLPALEFAFTRRASPLSLLAASLVVITYSQAYLCFFGDGIEIDRHMFPAFVLYRITSWVGIAAFVALTFRAGRHRLQTLRPEIANSDLQSDGGDL